MKKEHEQKKVNLHSADDADKLDPTNLDEKKEAEKPNQSLAQPEAAEESGKQPAQAAVEMSAYAKGDDSIYDTSEIDNFNTEEDRAVEGQLDGKALTAQIGKPLVNEIKKEVHAVGKTAKYKHFSKRK